MSYESVLNERQKRELAAAKALMAAKRQDAKHRQREDGSTPVAQPFNPLAQPAIYASSDDSSRSCGSSSSSSSDSSSSSCSSSGE